MSCQPRPTRSGYQPTHPFSSRQSPSFRQPQTNNIIRSQQNQLLRPIRNQTSPTFTARSWAPEQRRIRLVPPVELGHWASSCPHRSAVCYHCGLKGHLSRVCRNQAKPSRTQQAGQDFDLHRVNDCLLFQTPSSSPPLRVQLSQCQWGTTTNGPGHWCFPFYYQ